MKTLELFRSNSSGKLQLVKHGVMGVCALLSIAALITSFTPKPSAPDVGCYAPTYNLNNHTPEAFTANIRYYTCSGSQKEIDGIAVPASTLTSYLVPGDSQHIMWVHLICPATSLPMAGVALGTCSQSALNVSCNSIAYCITFAYTTIDPPWCLDGGAINISSGSC